MIEAVLSVIGIVLCMVGTVATLWLALNKRWELTSIQDVIGNNPDKVKREKRPSIWGLALIVLGSLCQIAGVILPLMAC